MTMTLPSMPVMPAGTGATSAQMNALAYACTFLLGKPLATSYDNASGASIASSGSTQVNFTGSIVNTDGMWTSGNNYWTIQTPGWYRVTYNLCMANSSASGACYVTRAQFAGGTNSPYNGSTLSFAIGGGQANGTNSLVVSASSMCPVYCNAGDTMAVFAKCSASGAVLSTANMPSTASLEWMSI